MANTVDRTHLAFLCRATLGTDLSDAQLRLTAWCLTGDDEKTTALLAAFDALGADEYANLAGKAPALRAEKNAPWA